MRNDMVSRDRFREIEYVHNVRVGDLKIRANVFLLFNLFFYVHRENSFAEEFKNLARCRSENNFVGPSLLQNN